MTVGAARPSPSPSSRHSTRHYLLSSGMPGRALRTSSPTTHGTAVRAHVIGESGKKCKMGEELPILKGILNGVVNYHNARRCLVFFVPFTSSPFDISTAEILSLTYTFIGEKADEFLSRLLVSFLVLNRLLSPVTDVEQPTRAKPITIYPVLN